MVVTTQPNTGYFRKNVVLPEISLADTEFDPIMQQLITIIRQNSDNSDFLAHSNTVLMTELVAYITSLLSFKQDFLINQAYLATAVSPEAILRLITQLGIKLARPRPGFTPIMLAIVNKEGVGTKPLTISTRKQPYVVRGKNGAGISVAYEIFDAEFTNVETGVERNVEGFLLNEFQNQATPEAFGELLLLTQVRRFPELDPAAFYRVERGSMTLTFQVPNDPIVYSVVDTPYVDQTLGSLGTFIHPKLAYNDTDPTGSPTLVDYNSGIMSLLFNEPVVVDNNAAIGPFVNFTIQQIDPVPDQGTIGAAPLVLDNVTQGSGKLAVALQGQTILEEFLSTGAINQAFQLQKAPVVESSLGFFVVEVGTRNDKGEFIGKAWAEIPSLALSNPQATVKQFYEVETDRDYRVTVRFGNGVTGDIPSAGAVIQISYRVGGGLDGVAVPHSMDRTTTFSQDNTVYRLRLENPNPVSNATDGETVERARLLAPAFFQTQFRAVTGGDYTVTANRYPDAVLKALATLVRNTAAANIVRIYALKQKAADGSALIALSTADKAGLSTYMADSKMETDTIEVFDGQLVLVNAVLDVYIRANANKSEILESVNEKIVAFFDWTQEDGPDYGVDFRMSSFMSFIQCVDSNIQFMALNSINGRAYTPFQSLGGVVPCDVLPAGSDIAFDEAKKVLPVSDFQIFQQGCIVVNVIQEG